MASNQFDSQGNLLEKMIIDRESKKLDPSDKNYVFNKRQVEKDAVSAVKRQNEINAMQDKKTGGKVNAKSNFQKDYADMEARVAKLKNYVDGDADISTLEN